MSVLFLLATVSVASAGILSVRVPTKSGIEARFGMVELFTVNWAKNYNFYDSVHDFAWHGDPEGVVRDNYMSHMVYFPIDFVKAGQWRAHVLFSYKGSDYDQGADVNHKEYSNGVDYDRWRVERAYFEFKLNFLPFNAWLGVGHDIWTLDRRGGALVYLDDDPGIRFYGNYGKFMWDMKYIRKSEQTDVASLGVDSNRDVLALKLGYDFSEAFKPQVFFAWDRNGAMREGGTWDIYYIGANSIGKIGPVMYQAEFVYQGGNVDLQGKGIKQPDGDYEDDFDVNAWAALLNLQVDIAQWVPSLNKFVIGLGGVYFSGDDDANDDDLEGFVGVTNASRFFKPWEMGTLPVHGVNTQPVIGNTIYGWNPTGWGVGPGIGGVIGQPLSAIDIANAYADALKGKYVAVGNLGAHGDNPGLIAGVFTIDWVPAKKWAIKAMVKYLRWDDSDPIEASLLEAFQNAGICTSKADCKAKHHKIDIDEEIGWETDLMISYKIYPNVTIFGGISALFPGDGIDDINKAVWNDDDSDTAYHGQLGVKFVF